jgi:BMFP domain-containing protein YqiC
MKEAPLSPMERALLDQVQESLEKMDLMRREIHELREALRDERRARVKLERLLNPIMALINRPA